MNGEGRLALGTLDRQAGRGDAPVVQLIGRRAIGTLNAHRGEKSTVAERERRQQRNSCLDSKRAVGHFGGHPDP